MATFSVIAAVLSGGCSGLQAAMLGTPFFAEIAGGVAIALFIAPLLTWPLAKAALALHDREIELERDASTDHMTSALNRRGFFAAAIPMFDSAPQRPLYAMLLDLDFFKAINDTYGHAAGDEVVSVAARAIMMLAQSHDGVVGRIGGDEFCVLFPALDGEVAPLVAERLRAAVESRIVNRAGRAIRVTASIGFAVRRPEDLTLDDLLARADASLYAAKSQGRNRAAAHEAAPNMRRRA